MRKGRKKRVGLDFRLGGNDGMEEKISGTEQRVEESGGQALIYLNIVFVLL